MLNSVNLNTFSGYNISAHPQPQQKAANIEHSNSYAPVPLNAYSDMLLTKISGSRDLSSKGSSPQIAQQLKELSGTLDEKILKAKDIILKDLGIPPEAVTCENRQIAGGAYAQTSLAEGKIYYDKAFCQNSNSQFSDNAVLCILRHELDHLVVAAKLYKTLGGEQFEKLMQTDALKKIMPPEMQKVNHEIYQKLIQHVDTNGFNPEKYVYALENYNKNVDNTGIEVSNYRKFNAIINNFDNEMENSARAAQYELEQNMCVTTLKDFYSMIDGTKEMQKLLNDYKNNNPKYADKNDFTEVVFNSLYKTSMKELGLEDLPENWGKIVKNAEKYLSNQNKDGIIDEAYNNIDSINIRNQFYNNMQ